MICATKPFDICSKGDIQFEGQCGTDADGVRCILNGVFKANRFGPDEQVTIDCGWEHVKIVEPQMIQGIVGALASINARPGENPQTSSHGKSPQSVDTSFSCRRD